MEKVRIGCIPVPKVIVDKVAKRVLPQGQELAYYFPLAKHPDTGEYTVRQPGRIIGIVNTDLPIINLDENGIPRVQNNE